MASVIECPRCSTPNAEGSRFCNNCGASLVTRVGVQERRVVTALFADLARSTSLGERLDPEVVRSMVGRFFELATKEIGARGGSVEKFSGDAVMAVFGLPSAHEDDPERAVRAAVAIRDGVAALAADTAARHGVALEARIGIESGEVVVGDPFGGATMATGDAMNVAARLEQQAAPGEIVIGTAAHDHVRDLVTAEPLGELAIRGRDGALSGWRVRSISTDVGRPRGVPGLEAPLTGRDEELTLLLDAARRARNERKAVLFTLLGVPGVGKSRLVREASARLTQEGWSVVRGRCLPYGDGITYWPLAEMLRTLAGIDAETSAEDAQARLASLAPDTDVADRLALTLGGADSGTSALAGTDREIAWATRRLVEHLAADRGPLVLVFEDIHWAQPPLLDLIEYVVTWARDVPVLVICPSRPELLDTRPAWGAGRMEASRIQLEPLSPDESRALLGALLTVEDLPAALRQRVLDRAEGNPLFVEEVVRMLIEEGVVERRDGHWYARREAADVRVPDSVEALIRARLDTLPSPERAVLQAASVVGRVFQRSAVAAIAPEGGAGNDAGPSAIERHLEDAVLRDLITEERAPDEPTFRFRHILIRDVAYGTLPKARRAELHRGVAAWLRAWAGERIEEFIEIEAYHLEQAVALRRELEGRADSADVEAAAGALLASARKAVGREDMRAVRLFAERALALDLPPGERRLELEWLVLDALDRLGEWHLIGDRATRLEQAAAAIGRKDLEGRAVYARAAAIWISPEASDVTRAVELLKRARTLLTESHDDRYLLRVLEYLGYEGWWFGNLEAAERLWREQAAVARGNGWFNQEAEALVQLYGIYVQRSEIAEARRVLDEARELARRGGSRLTQARVDRALGTFLSRTASLDEGVELLTASAPVLEEFGDAQELHTARLFLGDIEYRRGRPGEAVAIWKSSIEPVREHVGYLPEIKRRIAQALIDLGEVDEAVREAEEAARITGKDDWATVAITRTVLGLAREAEGKLDVAEALLREGVEIIRRTDFSPVEQELGLAAFLLRRGRTAEGDEWLERARASARRYGPESTLIEWVETRADAARSAGG